MAVGTTRDGAIFVGGEFRPASDGATHAVLEKATGEPLADVGVATLEDLDTAVSAAKRAQPAWAATTYDERAAILRAAASALQARGDEIADLIVRETGSIPGKAQYEVGGAANELFEAAALTSRAVGEILPSHSPTRVSIAERVPMGVVGAITPWNFPLILGMRVVAPALALGNTVVLKPSPETPLTGGLIIAELLAEAGLPAGALNVVTGDQEIGERLVAHPDTAMIHFTGSSAVGSRIAEVAGKQLKRVSLELGGNNALVILEDADLDQAAMIGAWSAWHYQGQTCITAGRHIVARPLFDAYVEALAAKAAAIAVGDPAREDVGLGPMINERQRDRGHKFLTDSVAQGARIVEGGTYDGLFYRPTVVTDIRTDMPLWTNEIFAPITPVLAVDSEEEAIDLVNDTPYGLVNAVLTGDPDRGMQIASKLRSGMVHVNDSTCLDEAHVPFGGLGASGLGGRAGGESNLEEFTERRWVSLQRARSAYPY
ncbi:MAG TPA: aldehyde dehydrogenase family protein [Solirubrobacteraceae bacterium]|nr:aldehyde dehydrogenase family protein [Solirubrobacteraceae bacterium]